MCGIFGVAVRDGSKATFNDMNKLLSALFVSSESRGKESAGVSVYLPRSGRSWTLKSAQSASELIRSKEYRALLDEQVRPALSDKKPEPVVILAHSRLVTNGAAARDENNQPVRVNGVTVIHNGIVVNVDELWERNGHLYRSAEVDTEIIAALLAEAAASGASFTSATAQAYAPLKGAASIGWFDDCGEKLVIATNTGDLYTAMPTGDEPFVFASERHILKQSLKQSHSERLERIEWISPGTGMVIDLFDHGVTRFGIAGTPASNQNVRTLADDRKSAHRAIPSGVVAPPVRTHLGVANYNLLRYRQDRVRALRRCTCCVLPETFPFIAFDAEGVCNYCRSYRPRYKHLQPGKAKSDFIASLEHYRRNGTEPDVLVPFSGGRDSSYGLHLIKKEFGLNPITFTYDWGMVTDLARRNVARICGQLGIQNILVSADIREKRENIRKNVSAWLRRPDLGMIPLFMAGDKHFFSVVNKLKKQTGIKLDLWSANPLENTDFKSGFCGVSPDFDKSRVDYLSFRRKFKLLGYYGLNFVRNPAYLNTSLFDTAGAFFSYYIESRRDFFFVFDHMVWEENEVNDTLLSEYNWELAPDTKSTWRIGDGTAPFYNYIYMTARGFTEFDTFRSNQIREGMLTREAALGSIMVENIPRPDSIKWYLDTIGLPFNETIETVNRLDSLGLHS